MSFSFSSLVRLIVITALGTTMLAVGISKLDPPKPHLRTRAATRFFNLNEYFMNYTDRTPRWLDAESGRVVSLSVAEGDLLEAASCAPWVDEKGRRQVAGRWSSRTQQGPMSISTDFGLARYSFPDGGLLDQVSTENVPVGPPCWFPGNRARILFACGDGQLYHYAFEPEPYAKDLDPEAKRDARPTMLQWRCPRPGLGKVFLSDLTWPEDPSLSGYVVVSLREQSPESEALRTFSGTALWWLKLDHAGTEILEAGRLLLPDDEQHVESRVDQRSPTIGTLSDGTPAIAYMNEGADKQGWELRIAPIHLEGDHHAPKAHERESVLVASDCQPSHPAFSADGRWISAIGQSNQENGRIVRKSLSKVFAAKE
jgi:hypothetical protein